MRLGKCWYCRQCKCRRSILTDSFFSHSTFTLRKHLELIYWWCIDIKQTIVVNEVGLSRTTLVDWYNLYRDICCKYFLDNPEEHGLLSSDVPFTIRVTELGDFSVKLRLYVWTLDSTESILLQSSLYESVKKRFDKEGVEIPYPYRTIVEKKNLPKTKKLRKSG